MAKVTMDYQGTSLVLDILEGCSVSQFISTYNTFYELEFLETIGRLLPPETTVIDVGAHIGNHTLYFAKVLGLRVLAFEPNPTAFAVLEKNVEQNGLSESVHLHNTALGSKQESAYLTSLNEQDIGTMHVSPTVPENANAIQIEIRTLDSYQEQLQDLQPLSLIKLDVEESELAVLEGASASLSRFRPLLTTEVQNEAAYDVLRGFLEGSAYAASSIFNPTPTILWAPNDYVTTNASFEKDLALQGIRYGLRHALKHNDYALLTASLRSKTGTTANDQQQQRPLDDVFSDRLQALEQEYQSLVIQDNRHQSDLQMVAKQLGLLTDGLRDQNLVGVLEEYFAAQAESSRSSNQVVQRLDGLREVFTQSIESTERLQADSAGRISELATATSAAIESIASSSLVQQRLFGIVEDQLQSQSESSRNASQIVQGMMELREMISASIVATEKLRKESIGQVSEMAIANRAAIDSMARLSDQQNAALSAIAVYSDEVLLLKRRLERTNRVLRQRSLVLRTIIAKLRQAIKEKGSSQLRLDSTKQTAALYFPSFPVGDVGVATTIIYDSETKGHWGSPDVMVGSSRLVIQIDWQGIDTVIEASIATPNGHRQSVSRVFPDGLQHVAIAFIIDCMLRANVNGEIHYHYHQSTLPIVSSLLNLTRAPFRLYFSEVPDLNWRQWAVPNSANARYVLSEEQGRLWNSKYLFPASVLSSVSLTEQAGHPNFSSSEASETSDSLRLLIISYYMPPFATVAMQRLNYWKENLGSIAEEIGLPIDVHFYTASGQSASDPRITCIPDLGDEFCDDPAVRELIRSLDDAKVNNIGAAWVHYVRRYIREFPESIQPDVVLISGNPFHCFELGEDFEEKGSKVILDFRDPFAHNPRFVYTPEQVQLLTRLEDGYLSHADAVVSVNEHCLELIGSNRKNVSMVISNGYDESHVPNALNSDDRQTGGKVRFAYAGTFYKDCSPAALVGELSTSKHEFLHIGRRQEALDLLRDNGTIVEFGYQPYERTLEILGSCDIGVIFTGGKPFEHTTKIFDYIAVDIDILIVTEGTPQTGEIHNLTRNLDGVYWARNDPGDLTSFLANYHPKSPNRTQREDFSRREQTKKLISLVHRLSEQRH